MSAAPRFAAFGEALTDFVRQGDDVWRSVPGGAPWNVARAMAAFGVASAFGGAISRDCFGDALWQASLEARLDTRGVQRVDKSPLLAMVHTTHPPQYFFVGDDSADLHFDVDALPDEWLAGLRWALFGGISLAREPLSGRLLALAERLKRGGTKIAYDPNFRVLMDERYDPTLARMLVLADLVKLSADDVRGLLRCSDVEAGLAALRARNPQAAFFFTDGAAPARWYTAAGVWEGVPPAIDVVDTVGAGDCSLAGLLASLLDGAEMSGGEPLRAALAAGAGACLAAGAVPPSPAQRAQLAARVTLRRL